MHYKKINCTNSIYSTILLNEHFLIINSKNVWYCQNIEYSKSNVILFQY